MTRTVERTYKGAEADADGERFFRRLATQCWRKGSVAVRAAGIGVRRPSKESLHRRRHVRSQVLAALGREVFNISGTG